MSKYEIGLLNIEVNKIKSMALDVLQEFEGDDAKAVLLFVKKMRVLLDGYIIDDEEF